MCSIDTDRDCHGNRNVHFNADGNCDRDRVRYAHSDRDCNAERHLNGDADFNRLGYDDSNRNGHRDSDRDFNCDSYNDCDRDCDGDPERNGNRDCDRHVNSNRDACRSTKCVALGHYVQDSEIRHYEQTKNA